jgi:hypothetical protein
MTSASQDHPSIAATAHFVEAERLLAALPLVNRRDRTHHLMLALVNAVLAVAATMLGNEPQRQTITGGEDS